MKITENELLDALRDALAQPKTEGGGKTTPELAAELGCKEKRVRDVLRSLAREGRLEVIREPRRSISEALISVPTYRIKSP